jgi:hypothetical protein
MTDDKQTLSYGQETLLILSAHMRTYNAEGNVGQGIRCWSSVAT